MFRDLDNKGFTLIEIVTVIIVLGILGGFGISFLVGNSRTYQIMKVQRELYQDGVFIIERVSKDIRDSEGSNAASCPNGFLRRHPSTICLQYVHNKTERNLTLNNKPIGRDVIAFNISSSSPYTVSIVLEKECGMPVNQDGTTSKCRVELATSVLPMNATTGEYKGNYEEVIY